MDFYHALGKMADGKVMMCLWSGAMLGIHDGVLQGYDATGWTPLVKGELLEEEEMESMWLEVDE